MDRLRELVRLHCMGTGAREVARLLGMGPNTERAYRTPLAAAGALEGRPEDVPELGALKALVQTHLPSRVAPQQTSSLAAVPGRVEALLAKGLGRAPLLSRLKRPSAYVRGNSMRQRLPSQGMTHARPA